MTLIEAIQANNEKVFFELLSLRVNPLGKRIIDEVDAESAGNALYWATACGHLHFIEPLINAGIDVKKPNNLGWTPVYVAAHFGYAEIITTLKTAGVDVNMPDDSGTPPVCAAAYGRHAKAIAALKAAGADVDATEVNGLTPLYIAVQMGDVTVINALLEVGADANIRTPQGTLLELAKQDTTQKGQDIVRLLETHLQQYSNGIKALAAPKSAQSNQTSGQETCAVQMRQYDALTVDAKAGRDVVTITGDVKGREIALGGGDLSCAEGQNSSDNNLKAAPTVDDIAVLKQLKLFFMSNKYKGLESPDCELYNRVLDSNKAMLVYLEEERVHRLFINDEPLEPQNAIKMLSKMIASLQPLSAQGSNITPNTFCSTTSPNNTHVQARAGRDVITITGGITSEGGLRIGGGNTYSFTAYNQFKSQAAGQDNVTGIANSSMQLGSRNAQNNKPVTLS